MHTLQARFTKLTENVAEVLLSWHHHLHVQCMLPDETYSLRVSKAGLCRKMWHTHINHRRSLAIAFELNERLTIQPGLPALLTHVKGWEAWGQGYTKLHLQLNTRVSMILVSLGNACPEH